MEEVQFMERGNYIYIFFKMEYRGQRKKTFVEHHWGNSSFSFWANVAHLPFNLLFVTLKKISIYLKNKLFDFYPNDYEDIVIPQYTKINSFYS